jgi:hypothetical protein
LAGTRRGRVEVAARVFSCEVGTSGLRSAAAVVVVAAATTAVGAVDARLMNGDGRSGSSIVHLAGVAASLYW